MSDKELSKPLKRSEINRLGLRYAIHTYVTHCDGSNTGAPAVVFADYDYEVGDGVCGLHESDKHTNEPAIIYVRLDAYRQQKDRIEQLEAECDLLKEGFRDLALHAENQDIGHEEFRIRAMECADHYLDGEITAKAVKTLEVLAPLPAPPEGK